MYSHARQGQLNRVYASRLHRGAAAVIDLNLDGLIVNGRGIKGAYWANFLSSHHVQMAGGQARLADQLSGLRIEPLGHGGLLIIATDAPLPRDSEDSRARFDRLRGALKPAFLARAETPENKRALLGEFYRENNSHNHR